MSDFRSKFNEFMNTEDTTYQYNKADIEGNKVMAILAYISWLVLVPIIGAYKSPYARFHANQGLVLAICEAACWIIFGILGRIPVLGILFSLIDLFVSLALLALAIIGIINVANGKAKELPLIGKFKILK